MADPKIPPRVQTNGCTAYALAVRIVSVLNATNFFFLQHRVAKLTFVFRLLDHLSDHGLHDRDVAVEGTSNETSQESHPVALGHTEYQAGDGDTTETNENNRLATILI